MVTKWADLKLIAGCCILLVIAVTLAGCTGSNATTAPPVTTPAQPELTSIATTVALPPQTTDQTPSATPAKTEMQTSIPAAQPQEAVTLTINSAKKQTKVYTMVPAAGRMFLVLNITVKNNGLEKGFDLTDKSMSLSYARAGTSPEPSVTSLVRGGLDNPILTPTTIEQHDHRTGQVVFGVAEVSGMYTLNLIDDRGTVVSSASVTA